MSIKIIDDIDIDKIIEFKKTNNAWLTVDNDIIPCDMYSHFKALGEEYKNFEEERYEQLYREMREQLNAEYESDPKGFHPAYHRFDTSSEAKQDTYKKAYEDGYIRLSIGNDRKGSIILEALSSAESLKNKTDFITDLAKFLDVDMLYLTEESHYYHKNKTKKINVKG
jgi:hypothetical protein